MPGNIVIRIAGQEDTCHVHSIIREINEAAQDPAAGICKRTAGFLAHKIEEGLAVIAVTTGEEWVGFCYIQEWEDARFVSSCALVIAPAYRNQGVAAAIKAKIFELARAQYPDAVLFGLTTSAAVRKINSQLGYEPVPYSAITADTEFWNSCRGCQHYAILQRNGRRNCFCTAMRFAD